MTTRKKVLITDANYKHALGAARALNKAGFQVDGIGFKNSLTRFSRFFSKITYDQSFFNENYLKNFLKFLERSDYEVILPIGGRSVYFLAEYKKEIEKHARLPFPSLSKLEKCFDKSATISLAIRQGITAPKTWDLKSIEEVKDHLDEFKFPLVVKGRHELFKAKPIYAMTKKHLLKSLEESIGNDPSFNTHFPLIQQYVSGQGCGFFALYQKGKCKRIFMHRRIREFPASGGASCCAESIYEEDLMEAGKKLLDALQWDGIAMVEFKRDFKTKQLYLMEINAKFWGSLELAIASGVNFPVLAVNNALGKNIPFSKDYRVNLRYHWPLSGEAIHVIDNPKAIWDVLLDCLNPKTKSNLWWTDPKPTLKAFQFESKRIIRQLFEKRKKDII
ncbi:MAG: carboxylate--amine ligase [Candidatus Helarchaeota archaeon]